MSGMIKKMTKTAGVLLGIATLMAITFPINSYAAFPIKPPFGGIVALMVPCTCSFPDGSIMMTIAGIRGGLFMLTAKTIPFAKYTPLVGKYVLGFAFGAPMPCMVTIPNATGCTLVGRALPAIIMGTN